MSRYDVELWDIFNTDETELFYGQVPFVCHGSSHTDLTDRIPPNQGLADKKSSGMRGTKVQLTCLSCRMQKDQRDYFLSSLVKSKKLATSVRNRVP